MKELQISFLVFVLTGALLACNSEDLLISSAIAQPSDSNNYENLKNLKLKITVEKKEFIATLYENEAVLEFITLLPMTVTMNEHNGDEKYYNLPKTFPGKATKPDSVQAGDLMIWSSSTLVLFYDSSSTPYSYIRLGHVDNISGLREALGRTKVVVVFELEPLAAKQNCN